MADLSVTAANVLASSQATILRQYPFGGTVTAGQLVYLNASSRWVAQDANASATGNGVTDKRGIALHGGASGQPAAVAVEDPDFTPGATLTAGTAYFASATAGGICPAADLGTGDYPTFVGIAKSTSKLHLRPAASGVALS